MQRYLVVGLLLVLANLAKVMAGSLVMHQRVILSAGIVASTCRVAVDGDVAGSNKVSFGIWNHSSPAPVSPSVFRLSIYEEGATVPGCSAFLVAPLVTLRFGDPGQLDMGGVVIHGAGDGIRIAVRALDSQSGYGEKITLENNELNYPAAFAAAGRLNFEAAPENLNQAKTGEYYGALSFVVTWH